MKKRIVKIISVCLCTIFLICSAAYAVTSSDNKVSEDKANATETAENTTEDTEKLQTAKNANDSEADNIFKDETVYVIANPDGTIEKIIVSDWIKNTLASDKIEDVTDLKNLENVKGDETYTLGGFNSRVWDAQGNDIYYQGTIDKELPVNLKVSYKLNGKSVSPEELAGKNGKVTIRFDYENNQYETVKINGKEEKIYVPFAMLTGMILDNSKFTNIEVSNGKIINDGDRTMVIGLALPGLEEDLGIDRDELKEKLEDKLEKKIDDDNIEIPSYVEITADVTDFSLGMTVTVATNALLNNVDTEKIDSLSDLTDSVSELNDAMTKLLDGSSSLYDGLCTLLDKSSELVKGIDQLADGAGKLKDGAYSLKDGAEKIYGGAEVLSQGLDTLAANNGQLNEGAKRVFETFLATAEAQLKANGLSVPTLTVDNYASVLNEIIDSLDEKNVYKEAQKQVKAAVEENRDYIESQVTEAVRKEVAEKVTATVREQVSEKVTEAVRKQVEEKVTAAVRENVEKQVILAATGMDKSAFEAAVAAGLVDASAKGAVEAAVSEKMASEEIKALVAKNTEEQMKSKEIVSTISQKVDEQMETEEVKNIIKTNTDSKMKESDIQALIEQNTDEQIQKIVSEKMASDEIQSKLAEAAEGAKSIITLKTSLDEYNTFYQGLKSYTAGVEQAANGASDLKDGAGELKNGTQSLYDGISSLYDGILTMKNGIPALTDGITQLKDGAMQLSSGLKRFNEEGIKKLIESVDDADEFIERFKAIINVSKNYKSFAGISDDEDGSVRFIYKIGEIKENEQ